MANHEMRPRPGTVPITPLVNQLQARIAALQTPPRGSAAPQRSATTTDHIHAADQSHSTADDTCTASTPADSSETATRRHWSHSAGEPSHTLGTSDWVAVTGGEPLALAQQTISQQTLAQQKLQSSVAATPPTPAPAIQPRWACLYLPHWPIQRLVAQRPELRRQRVVLFADQPPRGRLVTAASPLALRAGVKLGMPVTEAKSLCKPHPAQSAATPAYWLPADPAADLQQLERLADDLNSFSPIVGLASNDDGADGLWLEVTGLSHLFGDEANWLRQLLESVQTQGYWAYAAIANTHGQAWAWAHYYPRNWLNGAASESSPSSPPAEQTTSPRLSTAEQITAAFSITRESTTNVATTPTSTTPTSTTPTSTTPASTAMATAPRHERVSAASPAPTGVENLLDWLPPAALRLRRATLDTLQRLGIETLAQLQRLPRASLVARFGTEINQRWDQFWGAKLEVISVRTPPNDYQAVQLLDFPLTDVTTIEVIIRRLVTELCEQLYAKRLGAWQWRVQLDRQGTVPFVVQVDLYEPSCSAESLLDLIHLHLERYQQRELLAGAIEEISVAARRWVPLGERQRLLFDEDPKPNQQALAGLVNRLVIRLGAHQVLRPLSVSGVQPEYARRYRSWVGGATRNSAREPREVFQGLMARPLQMVSQPLPLRVSPPGASPVAASNSMPSAAVPSSPAAEADAAGIVYPPATLIGDDRVYNIQQWWGPERIETGWWRGRPVRRDYWRIECGDRCQYWIFYDLQKHQWYLQGWF